MRQLQNLDPAGWTELLAQAVEGETLHVTKVDAEPLGNQRGRTRYYVTLADHTDPITFVAKRTTAVEALFYEKIAPDIDGLVPRCWFSEVVGQSGWVVLSEIPAGRPPEKWDRSDIDTALQGMSKLHAAFWNQGGFLANHSWLPHFRDEDPAVKTLRYERKVDRYISMHAVQNAGRYAEPLIRAASGLRALRQLQSWPNVFDQRHIQAATDLLDDPMPMLQPLRDLPHTLLHGQPDPEHWHITLFDTCHLFDWQQTFIGPAPLDLVVFSERLDYYRARRKLWNTWRERRIYSETVVDSYLLAMSRELGQRFPAREVRLALPAAQCLYTLIHWFPVISNWTSELLQADLKWTDIRRLPEEGLRAQNLNDIADTRAYLQVVFNRFIQASKTL